jgi:hypothetical protein
MRRLFEILLKMLLADALLVGLVLGVIGRSRDILFGFGQNPLFPSLDHVLYLNILPGAVAITWIMLSFKGRFIHLKLLLSACLILSFGIVLPEMAALLHPIARPDFPEDLVTACMNLPVPRAEPYFHGQTGPHRIAPSGETLSFYSKLPEEWAAQSVAETQLVLCSDGLEEFVISEMVYEVPYLTEGIYARRVQYIENFRLVAAGTGETISYYTGYGDFPPDFPDTLYPPLDFFRKPGLILTLHGSEDTRRGLLFWLYRYVFPGPRTPSWVF